MDNIDELWKQSKDNHTELSNQLKDLKEQIITNNTEHEKQIKYLKDYIDILYSTLSIVITSVFLAAFIICLIRYFCCTSARGPTFAPLEPEPVADPA